MSRLLGRWLLAISVVLSIGYTMTLVVADNKTYVRNIFVSNKKSLAIEKLLGTALPAQVNDLHYFKSQPSNDLQYYTAYIKYSTPKEAYITLIQQMHMNFHNTGGDANLYLPTAWVSEPNVEIDWWNPSSDTPVDAAAKAFGTNGWILAKYERGYVYLIVTDSGYLEGTPGPF